jgi:hypothetical protein
VLEQKDSLPEKISVLLRELVEAPAAREKMQTALARWHAPAAAEQIAEIILATIAQQQAVNAAREPICDCGHAHGSAKHAH